MSFTQLVFTQWVKLTMPTLIVIPLSEYVIHRVLCLFIYNTLLYLWMLSVVKKITYNTLYCLLQP